MVHKVTDIDTAAELVEDSLESWANGQEKSARYELDLAKTKALIAIAERLDWMFKAGYKVGR